MKVRGMGRRRSRAWELSAGVVVLLASARARAEPAGTCAPGLVAGVSAEGAASVVAAVCARASVRAPADLVRVSVIGTDDRIVVVVSRADPSTGKERTVRVAAATLVEARRDAPAAFEGSTDRSAAPVDEGSVASPPSQPSQPSQPPPRTEPAPRPRSPRSPARATEEAEEATAVEVDAPDDVTLELSREGSTAWEIMCTGRCAKELPYRAAYRFVNSRGKVMRGFRLEGTRVRFSPRDTALDVVGATLLGLGSLGLLAALATEKNDAIGWLGLGGIIGGGVMLGANGNSVDQGIARPRNETERPSTASGAGIVAGASFSYRF